MNQTIKYAGVAIAAALTTLGVTAVAHHAMDRGIGHFANADADNNGEITTAEWSAAAAAEFQKLDTNKDGKIVVGEIPRPGPRDHRRGHHGPDGGPGDDWAPGEQPPAPAPAGNAVVGNSN